MARGGDEEAGFSVENVQDELRVRAWGFWSVELAALFERTCALEARGGGAINLVWLDVASLKPMRDEGQKAWSTFFGLIRSMGAQSVKMIDPPPITKLQILRLCRLVDIPLTVI